VTHLRKRMLEELQRRNYSEGTTRAYLQAVQQFAVHFGKSPDKLGPDDLRNLCAGAWFDGHEACATDFIGLSGKAYLKWVSAG